MGRKEVIMAKKVFVKRPSQDWFLKTTTKESKIFSCLSHHLKALRQKVQKTPYERLFCFDKCII